MTFNRLFYSYVFMFGGNGDYYYDHVEALKALGLIMLYKRMINYHDDVTDVMLCAINFKLNRFLANINC